MKISIIGLGFVGNAMYQSFLNKIDSLHITDYIIYGYDKYKNNGIGTLTDCLDSDIIFTALPTSYCEKKMCYDNTPTLEVLTELNNLGYNKIVIIKSTVEPLFTEDLSPKFPNIQFLQNPEFLSAKTAYEDFHNQTHIVLGRTKNFSDDNFVKVKKFYSVFYENAEISECSSSESECMKIFCNSFYAVKIQFLNELYSLTQSLNLDYDVIIKLMLKNGWIHPMHTKIPGNDGQLSYGGLCFPKDTNALLQFMKNNNAKFSILESCIRERNEMRSDK